MNKRELEIFLKEHVINTLNENKITNNDDNITYSTFFEEIGNYTKTDFLGSKDFYNDLLYKKAEFLIEFLEFIDKDKIIKWHGDFYIKKEWANKKVIEYPLQFGYKGIKNQIDEDDYYLYAESKDNLNYIELIDLVKNIRIELRENKYKSFKFFGDILKINERINLQEFTEKFDVQSILVYVDFLWNKQKYDVIINILTDITNSISKIEEEWELICWQRKNWQSFPLSNHRINILQNLMKLYNDQRDNGNVSWSLAMLEQEADKSHDIPSSVDAYIFLAAQIWKQGQITKCEEYHKKINDLINIENNTNNTDRNFYLGQVTYQKGNFEFYKGKLDNALNFYKEAENLFKDYEDKLYVGKSFIGQGVVHRIKGDIDDALSLFRKGNTYIKNGIRDWKHIKDEINSLFQIGVVYENKFEFGKAIAYYQEAYDLALSIENIILQKESQICLGLVYYHKGDYEASIDYIIKGTEDFPPLGNNGILANAIIYLGLNYYKQKDYEKSKIYITNGLLKAEEYNAKYIQVHGNAYLGLLCGICGEKQDSEKLISKAKSLAEDISYHRGLIIIEKNIGLIKIHENQKEKAVIHFKSALDKAKYHLVYDQIFEIEKLLSNI